MGRVNERVSGWMKLDEGSRDGAEVKKKKHGGGNIQYIQCVIALQVNKMAYNDKRDSVAFYSQIHF